VVVSCTSENEEECVQETDPTCVVEPLPSYSTKINAAMAYRNTPTDPRIAEECTTMWNAIQTAWSTPGKIWRGLTGSGGDHAGYHYDGKVHIDPIFLSGSTAESRKLLLEILMHEVMHLDENGGIPHPGAKVTIPATNADGSTLEPSGLHQYYADEPLKHLSKWIPGPGPGEWVPNPSSCAAC